MKKIFSLLFRNKDNKEVSKNVIFTLVIKGAAMLISIFSVPAYKTYFGNDTAYGAWITISAVFIWINTFDFGIGNGLRNYLVKSIAAKDDEASKKYVSSAYVSIGVIGAAFLLVGIIASFFIPWNTLLKVPEDLITPDAFRKFIQIVFCGVVVHFFFLLINAVFYAIQKTFWPGLLTLITHIAILIYIILPNAGSLDAKIDELSFVYIFAYNIPLLIATLVIFAKQLKFARPSLKHFDMKFAKAIMSLGGMFFAIQIALIALNSSNEFFINMFYTPADVTQYHYYHKLFYIITTFVSLLGQPIWSAITKAYCEKRYKWMMGMWKVLAGIAALCAFGSILLALLFQPIVNIWLGKGVLTVGIFTVSLFAFATIQMTVINLSNCISNGMGKIKLQAILTVIGAVLKIGLVLILSRFMESWDSVILATILASLPLMIVQPVYIFRIVYNLEKNGEKELVKRSSSTDGQTSTLPESQSENALPDQAATNDSKST